MPSSSRCRPPLIIIAALSLCAGGCEEQAGTERDDDAPIGVTADKPAGVRGEKRPAGRRDLRAERPSTTRPADAPPANVVFAHHPGKAVSSDGDKSHRLYVEVRSGVAAFVGATPVKGPHQLDHCFAFSVTNPKMDAGVPTCAPGQLLKAGDTCRLYLQRSAWDDGKRCVIDVALDVGTGKVEHFFFESEGDKHGEVVKSVDICTVDAARCR